MKLETRRIVLGSVALAFAVWGCDASPTAVRTGVIARSQPGSVSYEFTTIDLPGASQTVVWGINAAGQIVGAGGWTVTGAHGFRLTRGTYETIDFSSSTGTVLQAINARGAMVGYFGSDPQHPEFESHGFILDAGSYRLVDYPSAASTWPYSVNELGEIVGEYQEPSSPVGWGFRLSDGVFASIRPPGSNGSVARDITNDGRIVGYYWKPNWVPGSPAEILGYLLDRDGFHIIEYPQAVKTRVSGINARGDIVGSYTLADGVTHGFVLRDGAFTAIAHPDAAGDCFFTRISDSGVIVGFYVDAQGARHGFTGRPR